MTPLSLDLMHKIWPHADQHVPGLAEGIVKAAPDVFAKYGIDSDLVLAHMLGQFSEECGAGIEMVENLNFSARGLMNTWPTRFGLSRALNYAHNPERIADAVYNGRMGNRPGTHDGFLYRGHGLSQITGREDYEKVGAALELPLVEHPELCCDPDHALLIATYDFVEICKCLEPARENNLLLVTRRLNGGTIGYADRLSWFRRWCVELKVDAH